LTDYLNDLWKFDGTNWTWFSGNDALNNKGIYGTKGSSDPANIPGARAYSISWKDNSGNLWLFGGSGKDSTATGLGCLNDVWKFDGANWTWVAGSNLISQKGIYGTKGIASSSNIPGCRADAAGFKDSAGNFWMFAGFGLDSAGSNGELNDVWKFDGTNWTWVSGSKIIDQIGVYGTKGTAGTSNAPGGRGDSTGWCDNLNNIWIFSGLGYDSANTNNILNDLWKFDGSKWTWMSGSKIAMQGGIYGTKGTAGSSNTPGSRYCSIYWKDNSGNFWLFGGFGNDSDNNGEILNDLWKYNP
jgi:N-acetylneuraminic acid mutarotase